MAPFTPFLSDNIYLRMKEFISDDVLATFGEDFRSVHFLSYPQVRKELFDESIELAVSRMQTVIELGRNIREKKSISLKTPLKSLVILHDDPSYLKDVDSLKTYIQEELNVRDIIITSDEDKYKVEYKAFADWPTLGKKLKKDMKKVKEGLPKLTSDEVKSYKATGEVEVSGIKLVAGDLTVTRGLPASELNDGQDSRTFQDVLVIMDVNVYEELKTEGLAREIINRIQKLRKKVGLEATDDVVVQYSVLEDNMNFDNVVSEHYSMITKTVRSELEKLDESRENAIADEDQTINDTIFKLKIFTI